MSKNNVVEVLNQESCTGCGACYNACPVGAIEMGTDDKGYYVPVINDKCINCKKCINVCPVINPKYENSFNPECYAMMMDDELRRDSSSGGAFSLFAQYFLEVGGLVCGVALDENFNVHHTIIENLEDMSKLRRSKYVQSDTGKVYVQIKEALNKGREVLFSGCPCQVAGLKNFLGKSYENLLMLDLVCHGAPPASAFKQYLEENYGIENIKRFDFRTKETGYNCYNQLCHLKDGTTLTKTYPFDAYERCMHSGLALKKSCAECLFAEAPRQADISIGDFWGIEKYDKNLNDGVGTSAVLLNNAKGKKYFEVLKERCKLIQKVPFDFARRHNRYFKKLNIPIGQRTYYKMLKTKGFNNAVHNALDRNFDVGVIGWWYNKNYGADLTYFALHTVLTQMGLSVLMVQTKGIDYNAPSFKFAQKKYDISRYYSSHDIYLLNDRCNTFISGSDQLFNPILWQVSGLEFFLHFANKAKNNLVSYASSFGHIYDDKKGLTPRFDFLLKRFNALSVREKYAVDICKRVFDLDVPCVCDPVFLCPVEEYNKLADESGLVANEKHLVNYILDPTKEKRELILEISKRLNLKYTNLTDMDNWQVKTMQLDLENTKANVSIEEWLFHYKNAEFIITDSFHGTCFAIIFRKPFISIANHQRGSNRFVSLLEDFGLMDRLVNNISDIDKMPQLFEPIDYDVAYARMETKIRESYNWLENAIKNPSLSKKITESERVYNEMIEMCGQIMNAHYDLQLRVKRLEELNGINSVSSKNGNGLKNNLSKVKRHYQKYGLTATVNRIILELKNRSKK